MATNQTIKKNINQIIKRAMHRPISSDGFALYTKVEGYNGGEASETKAEQSKNYTSSCMNNYNSPTNIRKLFITGGNVTVQYYTSMVTNKHQTVGNWNKTSFYPADNLFSIAKAIMEYKSKYHEYMGEKAINPKAVPPTSYSIEGNGLGVISNPWVCSNIEEIYFDWTLLTSNEVASYFPELCTAEAYTAYINGTTTYSMNVTPNLIKLFKACNSGGVKDLRLRFPRLKAIAMISNLNSVLSNNLMVKTDSRFSSVEDGKTTWFKDNEQLIKQSNSVIITTGTLLSSDIPAVNEMFTVKNSIYKFDEDILSGVIDAHKTKIRDYKRQQTYGASTEKDNQGNNKAKDINEIEEKIIETEKLYGEQILRNALKIASQNMSMKELSSIIYSLSKVNRQRVADFIGFVLK